MSRKDTHAERGKRSRRNWKPKYKSICNYYRKIRNRHNHFLAKFGIEDLLGHYF